MGEKRNVRRKTTYRSASYAKYRNHHNDRRRRRRNLGWTVGIVCGAIAVIIGALALGSYLQDQSDAYHASQEGDAWTLDVEITDPVEADAPKGSAISTKIDEWVDHDYDGAILYLGSSGEERVPFASETLGVAGISHGKWPLSTEVSRLHGNGFTVTGVFVVTSLSDEDAAVAAYRKGLEMALLTEFARAGLDDILLVGVPAGNQDKDAAAINYLREVKSVVGKVSATTAVGVSLEPTAFYHTEDEKAVYTDHLTPARVLTACDYLAADLRKSGESLEATLKALQFPYVRYGLRLLLNGEDETAEDTVTTHGFERYMLYRPIA